uniref:Uncharacterized protein n=1 Tax=Rhizophora mucronata TaxID=61149 RepID=A0A2P2QC98_RHIMU
MIKLLTIYFCDLNMINLLKPFLFEFRLRLPSFTCAYFFLYPFHFLVHDEWQTLILSCWVCAAGG